MRQVQEPGSESGALLPGMAVGVLLAFFQSLVFLAFFLLLCSRAGGATPAPSEFAPQLQVSVYNPVKVREPFRKVGQLAPDAKTLMGGSAVFRLQGILYEKGKPAALVNDQLVELNKPVAVAAGGGEIQVKAIEITRDRVVLDAGGQKIELQMNRQDAEPPSR
jgi:hypothetical protein